MVGICDTFASEAKGGLCREEIGDAMLEREL